MEFLKLSRVKMLNIMILICMLCSCSILDPYVDRRRNPGTSDISKLYTGRSKPNAPAICYNPLLTNEEELQTLANNECIKNNSGSHAQFVTSQSFSCKIFLPSMNFYKCTK